MSDPAWVPGDLSGLSIPADSETLRIAGESFLTEAFRASGTLAPDNRVVEITRFEDWAGGSTGRKLLLSVRYERPQSASAVSASPATPSVPLPTDLFVKFSRDFGDEVRDRSRYQMESEVRFASLSRTAGFPITVPMCLFADFQRESGTGILITQRVAFAAGDIEPHYGKCLDYEMPEPLEHYRAITGALGRLAGTHKAGLLGEEFVRQFPFDPQKLAVSERRAYTADQLVRRVLRFGEFAAKYPRLLPQNIASPRFIARLAEEVVRFPALESACKQFLHSQPDLIALCHWNANVDNAWFWRNAAGHLECGLLDWGHVSQMNVAMALWGSLSAAEIDLWDRHLEHLLALFVSEFQRCGGVTLDSDELKLHMHVYIALMGLAWLLDAPAMVQAQVPDLSEVESRFDPRLKENEAARVRLHMLTTFLNLWETQDFGTLIDRMQTRQRGVV